VCSQPRLHCPALSAQLPSSRRDIAMYLSDRDRFNYMDSCISCPSLSFPRIHATERRLSTSPRKRFGEFLFDLMFEGPAIRQSGSSRIFRTSHIDRDKELPLIDRLLTALSLKHETCGQTVDHRGASNPRVSRRLEPIACALNSMIGAQQQSPATLCP
jgi:hypothetical protein